MLNVPLGHVKTLEYRDIQPKMAADTSAFVVHFQAPDGEMYEHPLSNPQWMVGNPALQLMALNGFKPSDIDGTKMDVTDWQWMLPLAPDGDGGYGLVENVLEGGAEALRSAAWFDADDSTKTASGGAQAHSGGGGPDPSTGNRGGVEYEGDDDITAELTPDANTGVNVTVE